MMYLTHCARACEKGGASGSHDAPTVHACGMTSHLVVTHCWGGDRERELIFHMAH